MRDNLQQVLMDLRNSAGELRRFGKHSDAKRIEMVANKLDPNETKPAPIVPRTTSA